MPSNTACDIVLILPTPAESMYGVDIAVLHGSLLVFLYHGRLGSKIEINSKDSWDVPICKCYIYTITNQYGQYGLLNGQDFLNFLNIVFLVGRGNIILTYVKKDFNPCNGWCEIWYNLCVEDIDV